MARKADQTRKPELKLVKSSSEQQSQVPVFHSQLAQELDRFADNLDLMVEIIRNS